ncbi:protein tyrosine phosphatase domain-containing protein 1-like [Dendronephthya gigantea]|uniref:protein tyrosine phosphatase domain-containing protein 1-like n=1 Tax=Dendronephthya gigantea TaxID=151771 RepID=UPI00106BD15E|nr:protein tyrosine phosphatase domain-containing protein 1-like [Dendronephthya gigantea]
MDCGPKYSKVSESLRYVTSGSVQCSMFCGGRQCKYEGQAKWNDSDMVIKGLYSSWVTDNILAMARPSTRTIKKFNIIQQFQRWNITAVINLQHLGEHANCGFGLEKSGFTYNPQDFMDNGIFFFNYIWKDYGICSLESVLNIVKVMDFALQNGKVAVHCHAGLGRTGVLIACYLIYSLRISPEQAIHTVRMKRPRSVQTRGQISCVHDFAKFLKPAWIIFPSCCYDIGEKKSFNLQRYLKRQKRLLHGYEARELKFIPKIIFAPCKRLLELCGLDASKLRLTNDRLTGKFDDEIDSTDGEDEAERSENNSNESSCNISASVEDLKGEFDTENEPLNEKCDGFSHELSNSQPSGYHNEAHLSDALPQYSSLCEAHKLNTRGELESGRENDKQKKEEKNGEICNQTEGSNESHKKQRGLLTLLNKHATVEDVAAAFSEDIKDVDIDKVEKLRKLLNESNEAWKFIEEEASPSVLTALMVSWIDCLTEPILSKHDVETLIQNSENPREALLHLTKSQRGTFECLLATIFRLHPVDQELHEKALFRSLTMLTKRKFVEDTLDTMPPSEAESSTSILPSSKIEEFLKFCKLLYENCIKE